MVFIRSIIFNVLFYANLTVLLIIALPTLVMNRSAVFRIGKVWAKSSLWLLKVVCHIHVEFRGLENIPNAPFIVAAKHQSAWETFALIMLFDDFCYILKRELTYIPLFGWYLWKADQIAVDRTSGSSAMAQAEIKAKQIFAEGRPLFIFPEGTRRPAGAPPKYKFGVAHLYDSGHVPCLPIALNSGLYWARRSLLKRPGIIIVDILPPIAPGMEKQAFFLHLQETMEMASERLIEEALAQDFSLRPIIEKNRNLP
jgi:1-acyl-sn-glycerol-3-phosphate acyltransferase